MTQNTNLKRLTERELAESKDLDLPDGKRNLIREFVFAALIGVFCSIGILTAVCNADKIDSFVSGVVKWIVL